MSEMRTTLGRVVQLEDGEKGRDFKLIKRKDQIRFTARYRR
jgi:hypothetical protein